MTPHTPSSIMPQHCRNGDYVASQKPWQSLFVAEIMPLNLTKAEEELVLGGSSAMWGAVLASTMDSSPLSTYTSGNGKGCAVLLLRQRFSFKECH
jgi:hypothetical protein